MTSVTRALLLAFVLPMAFAGPLRAQEAPPTTAPPATAQPAATPAQPDSPQQEADRSFLTALIEDNLSGEGRTVRIEGFAGALSSRATFTRLTISDAEGPWLTIHNGAIQWNRAALLARRLTIEELSAERVELPRGPIAQGDLPAAEASGFALPELPVAVSVGRMQIGKAEIGAALAGQDLAVTVAGSASLADGEGTADLTITRMDGTIGRFSLSGSYANATRLAAVDLLTEEAQGGILAAMIGLPGQPPLTLSLEGQGPIDDFTADLMLITEGQPRLSGQVALRALTPEGATSPDRLFDARFSGDVTALFLPEYRAFFGTDVGLSAAGRQTGDGRLQIDQLQLRTRALQLDGRLALATDGLPQDIELNLALGLADGSPVLLPLSGDPVHLTSGRLALRFDADQGPDWQVSGQLAGISTATADLADLDLAGQGRLARDAAGRAFSGRLDLSATGLAPQDPALQAALGSDLALGADLAWSEGQRLQIRGLTLAGQDYGLQADFSLGGVDSALGLNGEARAQLQDLARFSDLAGRPLSGAAEARLAGSAGLLSGEFDLTGDITGRDLGLGQDQIDRLLAGESTIVAAIARSTEGTFLNGLTIAAQSLQARLSGKLATGASDLDLTASFADLGQLGPGYGGSLTLEGRLTETGPLRKLTAQGQARDIRIGQPEVDGLLAGETAVTLLGSENAGEIRLDLLRAAGPALQAEARGHYAPGAAELLASLALPDLSALGAPYRGALRAEARLAETGNRRSLALTGQGQDLAMGQPEADRLLAGQTSLDLAGQVEAGALSLDRVLLRNPQLDIQATGNQADDGARAVDLTARLANMALLVPGFPGPLTVSGSARQQGGADYQLNLTAQGPGGTDARLAGSLAPDATRMDLAINGRAQTALANSFIAPQSVEGPLSFDLRLAGAPSLAALSGRLGVAGARLSLPSAGLALQDINLTADLGNSQARLQGRAQSSVGGSVDLSGTVGLVAPYRGDLAATFNRFMLRDPELYETRIYGRLGIAGPLAGGALISGALDLDETEIRVPATGFGGPGQLDGLRHRNEPAPVRATRARAGMLEGAGQGGGGSGGGARPYGLDLAISVPNQIFVRGRGLDAELGGGLRLRGTTANVMPEGQFSLIRGRLDILTRRFNLTEGLIALQGSMTPYLRFVAATESDGETASVVIDGPADDPQISFTSSSGLPQEEVLSRLLFGRGLDTISPFQAAQLASAVAQLAGRGGIGIVESLRQNFGLDNLDVVTDAEGNTAVRAGKYIANNVYTDITLGNEDQSAVSLNLDVTRSITLRGTVESDGNSGFGIFFEKDY